MSTRLPHQIRFIVGTEACERFSYYGMLGILMLYLKNSLELSEPDAKQVVHLFKMAVYFLPLAGGWLADRWLGRYRTILILSLFYCLGHGALALWEGNRLGIYVGLSLIAIGAGGIKPCVSAFLGDQFGPDEQGLLPKVYGLFYWAINLGALLAFALVPLLRDHLGYRWAFGVPGIFMGLATLLFWLGTRYYVRRLPADAAQEAAAEQPSVSTRGALAKILLVFLPVPVFWALFDQINSAWVLQGTQMQPFAVLGYKVDAERIQSVSALLVLIWVPVLTLWLYPLAERLGLRPTPLRRMGAGMLSAAVAFLICGWLQWRLESGEVLSLTWQLVPYVFLELGEVMVSATGLEYAYTQAPVRLKSTVMSLWLCTNAVGNLLVAVITNLNERFVHAQGAQEFCFYALLMVSVVIVFGLVAPRATGRAFRRRRPGTRR